MEKWCGQVAFVTGASSGIGEAVSEELVKNGIKVVGFARRQVRLEEIAKRLSPEKGKFYSFAGDVAKEDDLLKALKWTKENIGPVSILVNNAGVMRTAYLTESSTQHWRDTFDVNVIGMCITTREAVKQMKENNIDGHIINLNSITGHTVPNSPKANLYSASKHAVTALTETLRLELATLKTNIRVTSISPTLVDTEMISSIISQLSLPSQAAQAMKGMSLKTVDVANAILYVLSAPKHVNISEITIRLTGSA